jgi:hypothetical protein
LKKDGFDANIVTAGSDERVKTFQVTVGAFKNKKDARSFASDKLEGKLYNMPKN